MGTAIDFNKPLPTLKDILFDVEMGSVFYEDPYSSKDTTPKKMCAKNHQAVVNQKTGEIISIVGNNYKLISNREALEIGKNLFRELYPKEDPNALFPFKVVAPKTMGSAHIDLIHRDVNFSVFEQADWLPFIRTTNSYNRSFALTYEIGFVRSLCSNGALFNKKSLKLKYYHSKDDQIDIQNSVLHIKATTELFKEQCGRLREFDFPRELMVPLVFKSLNVNLDVPNYNQINQKIKQLQTLIDVTNEITPTYFGSMGDNAYAAFNVLTDLVSHQDVHHCLPGYYLHVRSYYAKPTFWMGNFTQAIKDQNFKITSYFRNTISKLNNLKEQINFEWELN